MGADFLGPKHRRLYLIADIAGWFAWLVLVFGLLQTILEYWAIGGSRGMLAGAGSTLPGALFVARMAFSVVSPLMRAAAYCLLLRGVSVGLRMIVETDLNYRERLQEGAE